MQNIPDLILLTLLSSGLGMILLLVAPLVLPSLLPDPDDPNLDDTVSKDLRNLLDYLWIICGIGKSYPIWFLKI